MNSVDKQYLLTLENLVTFGNEVEGRNGRTLGLFGHQMKFDLASGFPMLLSKRLYFKAIVTELLWFLRGDTNIKFLHDNGVRIWDEWADEHGNLGPVYGSQWRSWPAGYYPFAENPKGTTQSPAGMRIVNNRYVYPVVIDQIANVIQSLKENPTSRRHIVTAWNPAEVDQMALPPCHCLFQFHVAKGELNCHLYQRSADWFLGVPFNIASYALLTHLIAREVGLQPGTFVHSFGDYHLYANHLPQATEQLERVHLVGENGSLPQLQINSDRGIFELEVADIELAGYEPLPSIKAEVSK